ncbi:MAG: hypothetical protein QOC62_839 [Mycobacterium sp.]|nr:hypothetical protein [Mycobacterium sp.]
MSEMKYLDLHGERVAYREAGSGEALLLIHGMAGSSATWRAVLPQLSKKYRVVAPDLLGHGESAKPRGDYSLGAFAVWLRDLLDELGIARATVVGQSLGGGVAMQFTYQHRDYCERLVLISSGGLGPDLSWILRILSAPAVELVLPVVAPRPVLSVGNKLGSWLNVGRDPLASGGRDVEGLLIAVRRPDAAGVPAHAAFGGGLPRSGGKCAQPASSELWVTDVADLGGSGPDHSCRPRLRSA